MLLKETCVITCGFVVDDTYPEAGHWSLWNSAAPTKTHQE